MTKHSYYQPSEYEQMLIAAGWVETGTLDPDYLKYQHVVIMPCDYNNWQNMRREWDALEQRYDNEIEPLYGKNNKLPSYALEELERELLDRMAWLEELLGY